MGAVKLLGRHWDAYFEQQPTAGQQSVDKAHLKSAGAPAAMGNGHWRSQKGGEATDALVILAYVDAHRWACTNPRPSSCRGPKSAHDYVHTVRTQGPRADFFPRAWRRYTRCFHCPWHFWLGRCNSGVRKCCLLHVIAATAMDSSNWTLKSDSCSVAVPLSPFSLLPTLGSRRLGRAA